MNLIFAEFVYGQLEGVLIFSHQGDENSSLLHFSRRLTVVINTDCMWYLFIQSTSWLDHLKSSHRREEYHVWFSPLICNLSSSSFLVIDFCLKSWKEIMISSYFVSTLAVGMNDSLEVYHVIITLILNLGWESVYSFSSYSTPNAKIINILKVRDRRSLEPGMCLHHLLFSWLPV
jgi:hypothetical protein